MRIDQYIHTMPISTPTSALDIELQKLVDSVDESTTLDEWIEIRDRLDDDLATKESHYRAAGDRYTNAGHNWILSR